MFRNFVKLGAALLVVTAILAVALPASAEDEVPFLGRAEAVVTAIAPLPDDLLLLTVSATGQTTHLGEFTREESVVFDPALGTLEGTITFYAANGDELYVAAEGGFISATTAVGTYTFTGGTGRYAGASGEADFVGVTLDGIHITLVFDGTIEL